VAKLDNTWRTAFELYACLFWILGAGISALIGAYGSYGIRFMLLTTVPMLVIGSTRLYQGLIILNSRARIYAINDLNITLQELIKWQQSNMDKVWYGKGYYWDSNHTQKLVEYNSAIKSKLKPSEGYMSIRKFLGIDTKYVGKGLPFLHHLENYEEDIVHTLEHRYSHESVGGETGAGKGRKLSFDLVQAIVRGEGALIIDPKKDENLLDLVNATLKLLGQEHRLYCFTPAAPSKSCRINPFCNYTEVTELTERTMSIFSDQKEDAFKSFAWRAVNTVLQGLTQVNAPVSLKQVLHYLESEIDDLMVLVGREYLGRFPEMKRIVKQLDSDQSSTEIKAKLVFQQYEVIRDKHPDKVMNTIISTYQHDRSHYKKLYQNILPPLTQLTSGSIRDLLSPSELSPDQRPIVDIRSIAHRGDILYVNLASLRDKTVANALGSLVLADTISVISDRYFCYKEEDLIPFNIYGDESSDYVNDSAVNLANKSRGSKSCFKFYFQTVGDIEVRLGSAPKADQMLGNTNTKSFLRTGDPNSMEKFTAKLLNTTIKRISEGVTTQTTAAKQDIDFNTGYTKQGQEVEIKLIPPETLGYLMDLHSFTQFPGGEVAKLRVPYISCPTELKYEASVINFDAFGQTTEFEELSKVKKEGILMGVEK
jgi:conjugal transfer pilus assembly protein TraD|tara:strand:- start:31931 stop:33883 length:1953 start_codon:yes stop_codon:yes gene_type:complete